MAEAFFNQMSGKAAVASSAGSAPAENVDPTVVRVMQEAGIDLSTKKPRKLTEEMIEEADLVVTMGCGVEGVCPAVIVETLDWSIEDPHGKPLETVRRIRDEIRHRIHSLLEGGL